MLSFLNVKYGTRTAVAIYATIEALIHGLKCGLCDHFRIVREESMKNYTSMNYRPLLPNVVFLGPHGHRFGLNGGLQSPSCMAGTNLDVDMCPLSICVNVGCCIIIPWQLPHCYS